MLTKQKVQNQRFNAMIFLGERDRYRNGSAQKLYASRPFKKQDTKHRLMKTEMVASITGHILSLTLD